MGAAQRKEAHVQEDLIITVEEPNTRQGDKTKRGNANHCCRRKPRISSDDTSHQTEKMVGDKWTRRCEAERERNKTPSTIKAFVLDNSRQASKAFASEGIIGKREYFCVRGKTSTAFARDGTTNPKSEDDK
mmetsp:Transcript_14129/g.32095  ORF Transcript_14129/g.32095 Transcript_14129/m.32095 type:complete len:131 (-) Transcript_14129:21-413(-)